MSVNIPNDLLKSASLQEALFLLGWLPFGDKVSRKSVALIFFVFLQPD